MAARSSLESSGTSEVHLSAMSDEGPQASAMGRQSLNNNICAKGSIELPILPREIQKQIVMNAMTTKSGVLKMPCLTPSAFKPGINLSCLLLK